MSKDMTVNCGIGIIFLRKCGFECETSGSELDLMHTSACRERRLQNTETEREREREQDFEVAH